MSGFRRRADVLPLFSAVGYPLDAAIDKGGTMDDVLQAIQARRSVRKFTGAPVAREKLLAALEAAMAAPSARNARPWSFLVVTERSRIDALSKLHPYAAFGADAGAIILPFGAKKSHPWFDQDMAAATENLLLAAAHLGLGATWCGMDEQRQAAVRMVVGLPEDQFVFAFIPVGIPSELPSPRTQFEASRVHWDRFGNNAGA
jgi:nitroreductase